jgi:hypothetical protein
LTRTRTILPAVSAAALADLENGGALELQASAGKRVIAKG